MADNVDIKADDCIGCGSCVDLCPSEFEFDESETKAMVKLQVEGTEECIQEAIESCPAQCILWSAAECALCETSPSSCSDVFAFNENEDMNEVMLPEGSIEDCLENALDIYPEEWIDLSEDSS